MYCLLLLWYFEKTSCPGGRKEGRTPVVRSAKKGRVDSGLQGVGGNPARHRQSRCRFQSRTSLGSQLLGLNEVRWVIDGERIGVGRVGETNM